MSSKTIWYIEGQLTGEECGMPQTWKYTANMTQAEQPTLDEIDDSRKAEFPNGTLVVTKIEQLNPPQADNQELIKAVVFAGLCARQYDPNTALRKDYWKHWEAFRDGN